MILTDLILGRENAWADVFDAARLNLGTAAKKLVKENANVAKRFVADRLGGLTVGDAAELSRGEGAVVRIDGKKIAAYRDEDGQIHAVSPVCTHLGCLVSFNIAEKTWDCPCHGSRFDPAGRVIQGPAVRDLEPQLDD